MAGQQPPYPYQQPPQGQHSNDYAPYPQVQQGSDPRYGTPVMGAPANPDSHPDNKHAATGSFSYQDEAKASQSQPAPSVPGQAGQSPYVQASATPGSAPSGYKATMDNIVAQMTEYGKKAEVVGRNVWGHCLAVLTEGAVTTGPSVANTAWGRVAAGAQILTKGGFEGVFKSTFPVDADETLKKTYACFLSTSTGPVAGTLYISSKKVAFCSDKPLSYTPSPGQQAHSFYKVIVPVDKIKDVSPSVSQTKPAEKYIQVATIDNFEFWFMGFVNYDKGVRNLQAVLPGRGGQPSSPPPYQQQPYPPNQQPYPPNQNYSQDINPNNYGQAPSQQKTG